MSDNIYDKETRNWVKGILALNETRTALCGCIDDKLEQFISEVPNQQKNHLEQFFLCLEKHNIQQLKQLKLPNQSRIKKKKKNFSCEHELCSILMKRFIKIHDDNQILCDSYQWITVPSQTGSTTIERPIRDKSKKEETKERIWKITSLYMVIDKGDNIQQYQGLDDLDISKVVKIMKSCTIFVPDRSLKLYDAIISLRNDLMHSPHNHMEDGNVKKVIKSSKQLLDCLQISEAPYCKVSMQELRKLEENKIYVGYRSIETKDILVKVGAAKEIAAKLDEAIDVLNKDCKSKSKELHDLLEKICQTGS
ncbi:uncharacterized protein LOC128550021 [Mercenaria mercenaria]|uniref:uncharacterized protein LOC128550021 n=1 Tax=Mercenaria mercenaria TaxID=6596 RepID=UPI00234EF531|nr:uncharacterized protein LOC128550021 [Mercenaria mercenaria]